MAQLGIPGDPAVSRAWREKTIQDDPVRQSNTRGRMTFAMARGGSLSEPGVSGSDESCDGKQLSLIHI